MKLKTFFILSIITLIAGCASSGRELASACDKNDPTVEYHSYFEDMERCKGF